MSTDNLKIQTVAIHTVENPRNSMRVLDNLQTIVPKTYFSGNTKIKATAMDEVTIAKAVNHVILACDDPMKTFTVRFQEVGNIDFITLTEMKQFNYSSKKPIDVYVQNPLGVDVNIKIVYANDVV